MRVYIVVCYRKPIIGDSEVATVEVFTTVEAADQYGSKFWDWQIFEREINNVQK